MSLSTLPPLLKCRPSAFPSLHHGDPTPLLTGSHWGHWPPPRWGRHLTWPPKQHGYCGLPPSSWNLSHFLKYHTPSWFFSFLLAFSSYSPTHWAIKCGFSSGLFCGQSPSSNLSSKGFPKSLTYHLYAYQPPHLYLYGGFLFWGPRLADPVY